MQHVSFMQFADPKFLCLLAAFPLAVLVSHLAGWRPFGNPLRALVTGAGYAAATIAILVLAQPQQVNIAQVLQFAPRTVVGLLDDSGSMTTRFELGDTGNRDESWASRYGVFRDELTNFARTRVLDSVGIVLFSEDPLVVAKADETAASAASKLAGAPGRFLGTNTVVGIRAAIAQLTDSPPKGRVLVIMGDGEDDIKPADLAALSQEIKDLGAHVYLIIPDYGFGGMSQDMVKLVDVVNGQTFRVRDRADVAQRFVQIGQLEAPQLEAQYIPVTTNLSPFFALSGFLSLLFMLVAGLIAGGATRSRA